MRVNYKNVTSFVSEEQIKSNEPKVLEAFNTLLNKTGAGNDFLGWIKYPYEFDQEEFARIKKAAEYIKANADVLVVIGIGGSYLGAKAVIEAMKPYFKQEGVEIVFCGNSLSSTYMAELLDYLKDKSFCINVISKSGTTTEPAIAFRLCKELLESKYGKESSKRIFATTDKERGALRTLSTNEGYETFIVPDDIGGRYSWFTAVGLLPIACAGINIDDLMQGAKKAYDELTTLPYEQNPALLYASLRNLLYKQDKKIEVLVTYEPKLSFISEWWKQLYGESEGKNHKGILPTSLCFTTDLHSMGQFCQDGTPCFFETTIAIGRYQDDVIIPKALVNIDKLNYLAGKPLSEVEDIAITSTMDAHYIDGGHNNILIELDCMDEFNLGQLMFFFCKACAMSAYLVGVNPFNQPGVEVYKARMKELLSK